VGDSHKMEKARRGVRKWTECEGRASADGKGVKSALGNVIGPARETAPESEYVISRRFWAGTGGRSRRKGLPGMLRLG